MKGDKITGATAAIGTADAFGEATTLGNGPEAWRFATAFIAATETAITGPSRGGEGYTGFADHPSGREFAVPWTGFIRLKMFVKLGDAEN